MYCYTKKKVNSIYQSIISHDIAKMHKEQPLANNSKNKQYVKSSNGQKYRISLTKGISFDCTTYNRYLCLKPCSSWIKKREARPRQCPLLYIFKRNNLCEKKYEKKVQVEESKRQKVVKSFWFTTKSLTLSLISAHVWEEQSNTLWKVDTARRLGF